MKLLPLLILILIIILLMLVYYKKLDHETKKRENLKLELEIKGK